MTKQIPWLPYCLEFAINVLPRMCKPTLAIIQTLSIDLAFKSIMSSFHSLQGQPDKESFKF